MDVKQLHRESFFVSFKGTSDLFYLLCELIGLHSVSQTSPLCNSLRKKDLGLNSGMQDSRVLQLLGRPLAKFGKGFLLFWVTPWSRLETA